MRFKNVHDRRAALAAALLGVALPWAGCVQAGAEGPRAGAPAASPSPALTQQWLALRAERGHFDGASWNDAVDRWQGTKHQVMQQLARQALQQRLGTDRAAALLGPPDQVLPSGAQEQVAVLQHTQWQGTPAGELWLYRWRGTHDQLVLALHQGQVQAAGWWYAFE
jgi:hypothetical protein